MIRVGERCDGSTRTRVHDETIGKGIQHKERCDKCGATRKDSQLGLEKTPEEYVEKMVAVFREVRRVLKDDGTLWLNLGDSYAGGGFCGSDKALSGKQGTNRGSSNMVGKALAHNLKPKDLVGIPWRVAFALQSDGWYLRQDVIWSKPNPMPESVTDRCTKAHEYLFLLSKSQKYFYNAEVIKEDSTKHPADWNGDGTQKRKSHIRGEFKGKNTEAGKEAFRKISDKRNRRSVWTIPTQPFPEAHFAVMPEKLVEPCVLAGSREGDIVLDPFCGAGTVPYVAKEFQRQYIGIELNNEYIKIAEKRLAQKTLDLTNQFD